MAKHRRSITKKLLILLLTSFELVMTSMPSLACSFAPPPKPVMNAEGVLELPFQDKDYAVLGEVIGEKVIKKYGKAKLPVTAIQVRVLKSDTSRAQVGQELAFHLFTVIDPACNTRGISLTTEQYPVGSTLRIIASHDVIPEWEAKDRIRKVPDQSN